METPYIAGYFKLSLSALGIAGTLQHLRQAYL